MKPYLFGLVIWTALFGMGRADPGPVETAPIQGDSPYASSRPASSSAQPAAAAANASTQAQIANWISSEEGDGSAPADQQPGLQASAPRAIHGEVGAGVGSNGYRNVYGVADIPIGQNGDLDVAASNTNLNNRRGQGGQYTSLSVGLRLSSPSVSPSDCGMTRSVWLPSDDKAVADCPSASSHRGE